MGIHHHGMLSGFSEMSSVAPHVCGQFFDRVNRLQIRSIACGCGGGSSCVFFTLRFLDLMLGKAMMVKKLYECRLNMHYLFFLYRYKDVRT